MFFESGNKHVAQDLPVNAVCMDFHKRLVRSVTKDRYRNQALLG